MLLLVLVARASCLLWSVLARPMRDINHVTWPSGNRVLFQPVPTASPLISLACCQVSTTTFWRTLLWKINSLKLLGGRPRHCLRHLHVAPPTPWPASCAAEQVIKATPGQLTRIWWPKQKPLSDQKPGKPNQSKSFQDLPSDLHLNESLSVRGRARERGTS